MQVIKISFIIILILVLISILFKNTKIYINIIKRIFDILLSIILIIIFLPLLILVSLILLVFNHGKVLFKQKRTGLHGKEFKIYKFNTMNNNKVSKIGYILRKTSIDELPQLFNVLKGDMSIVGPRPWIVDYYKLLNKKQRRRTKVRPGMVGLAQVNGRNKLDVLEKIEYDLDYIDNLTIMNDIKIILKSICVVFSNSGVDGTSNYIENELNKLSIVNRIKRGKHEK